MREMAGERRQRQRGKRLVTDEVKINHLSVNGVTIVVPAKLIEGHELGCCVEVNQPVEIGLEVRVSGALHQANDQTARGRVVWCRLRSIHSYRVGVEYLEPIQMAGSGGGARSRTQSQQSSQTPPSVETPNLSDHYEVLQLSPNADADTIQRVYRLLAQRFHPDNAESGNAEKFRLVLEAFRVLSDPERRASFDAQYRIAQRARWKIFDQNTATDDFGAERAKRNGVLSVLYRKRIAAPAQAGMSAQELEEILGVPREHLECSLWYLKENGYVNRTDNGRHAITAKGVDHLETVGVPKMDATRMLPSPSQAA